MSRFDVKARVEEIAAAVGWTDQNVIDRLWDFLRDSSEAVTAEVLEFFEHQARLEREKAADGIPVLCDNCGFEGTEAELDDMRDLYLRVEPGRPMPAGDCPKCGGLCYRVPVAESPDF